MFTARKLVGAEVKEVDVVEPNVAYRTAPPVLPDIQRSMPFVLAAPRGFPAEIASERAVDVSTIPVELTRPITRFIVADDEVVILPVPTAAS
jgi:hypothetical protein